MTVILYQDSNARPIRTVDIQISIDSINKKRNKPTTPYNIIRHTTYELKQTRNKITKTTYNDDDTIIINIMTNDARSTRQRQQKPTNETLNLQRNILSHISTQVPLNNIILLESPPLLYQDIYGYNAGTYLLAQKWGVAFAPTLVGERHISHDGVHIRNDCRYLLTQTIAATILRLNPARFFGLARPPYGDFGPWEAPHQLPFSSGRPSIHHGQPDLSIDDNH